MRELVSKIEGECMFAPREGLARTRAVDWAKRRLKKCVKNLTAFTRDRSEGNLTGSAGECDRFLRGYGWTGRFFEGIWFSEGNKTGF